MTLSLINIRPGFNKQITDTAAEGQYVDGDFVRFRSGLPEKIGGWQKITSDTFVGVARAQHQWTDLDGRKYAVVGTHKCLILYYDGSLFDITPIEDDQTGATFNTTDGSAIVTVNLTGHNLVVGDLFIFKSGSVTAPVGAGFSDSDFTDQAFEVTGRTSANKFTITMASNATTTVSNSGSGTINRYVTVGEINQISGFGFGTGQYGGEQGLETTLNGAINDSVTTITLTNASEFLESGAVKINDEIITYTGKSANDLTGCTRGANGTTAAAHSDGDTVEAVKAWGEASLSSNVTLDPANWSLDNFGQQLIATIHAGRTFTWNPIQSEPLALSTRATVLSGAPTRSSMSIVSDQDRHLIMLGTETTIGEIGTQDKMFIRFSDQENSGVYEPTSTNTAGTFRLDDGTEIRAAVKAKDYILILTDTAAYTLQFVGAPFTFSIRKVGSNCGCISQHGVVYVDGVVYWMDDAGGFNSFNGTVQSLDCSVEDFVFTTNNPGDLGLQYGSGKIVAASHNSLYGEITWFYPMEGSTFIDRAVVYNYDEKVWYTMSLARTTWYDAHLFSVPYATEFDGSEAGTFPVVQGVTSVNGASTYWAHETGIDQVEGTTVTPVTAFIETGDFMLHVDGDGEVFTKIRRFIPDFKRLTGDAQVTINLKNYPTDSSNSSPLGPFTIDSTTQKIDTRARGRAASLKIENLSSGQTWRYGTFRADVQPDGRR